MTLRGLINEVLNDNPYNKRDKESLNIYMSAFPTLDYELEFENDSDMQIPDVSKVSNIDHTRKVITLGE